MPKPILSAVSILHHADAGLDLFRAALGGDEVLSSSEFRPGLGALFFKRQRRSAPLDAVAGCGLEEVLASALVNVWVQVNNHATGGVGDVQWRGLADAAGGGVARRMLAWSGE